MARAFSTHQAQPLPVWDMTKGLFSDRPGVIVPDGGCTQADNVVFRDGRIYPRPPLLEYTSAPTGRSVPVNHFYPGFFLGTSQYLIYSDIILTGGPTYQYMNVYYYDGGWVDLTVSPANVFGLETQPPSSTQFRNEWLFCPGNDELQQWAGSGNLNAMSSLQTDADLQPPGKPWYICSNASRVFLANAIPAGGNRNHIGVWWCATGNSTIWDTGSGNPLRYDAGFAELSHEPSEIVGMFFHGGIDILAFKRKSIYKATWIGLPVGYRFDPLTTDIGALSQGCITSYRSILVWLGCDFNLYAMPFRGQIQPIGDSIQNILEEELDLNYAKLCSGAVDSVDGVYYFWYPAIGDGGLCKKGLACNLRTGAWSRLEINHSDIAIMCASEYRPGYARSKTVFGSRDGKLYTFYPLSTSSTLQDGGVSGGAYAPRVVSKIVDTLQVFGADGGDSGEIHAMSLQGSSGKATPIFRAGATVAGIENASFQNMDQISMDTEEEQAFTTGARSKASRFLQIGVDWESGDTDPMFVDGITSWIQPRGADVKP